jgi:RNA polymerase-binding transcription factor DksA
MNQAPYRTKTAKKHGKTSTLEILGGPVRSKVQRKWAEHHRKLAELREQFLKGRDAQSESAKAIVSNSSEHIADAATDSFDRDCALALLSSTQNALYEIEQALNRIADGSYGICEISGKPIEVGRLRAIPWTRFSAEVQAQLENRSGNGRVQLGEVGSWFKSTDNETAAEDDWEEPAAATGRGRS